MGGKLLTEKDVASQIGMSVWWLRQKRVAGGGIPYLKMGDSEKSGVRYEQDAIDAYIRSRTRRSSSDQDKP